MNISPTIQKGFHDFLLKAKKHSPSILVAVGAISVVGAGVLAAKNTLKLEQKIDEGQGRLEHVNDLIEQGEVKESARTAVYFRNVVEVTKLYVIPGTLMVGGIMCFFGANRILSKRNAALAAAYNGLAASYEAYRERVREEYGEEKEREIYFGEKEVTEVVDGKKTTKKVLVEGEHSGSPFRFYYDSDNDNWSGFHDTNLARVMMVQNMYNDLLKRRGHVFLNQVLETLGIEHTQAGAVTGWRYIPEGHPEFESHQGDNFIEFNIRDLQASHGYILLDMNVDGTIFDKI